MIIFVVAIHWILSPEPDARAMLPVPLIEDLMMSEEFVKEDAPMVWLKRQLICSPDKIQTAIEATIGQRNNPVWALIRKLRFTASNFGKILSGVRCNRYYFCRVIIVTQHKTFTGQYK